MRKTKFLATVALPAYVTTTFTPAAVDAALKHFGFDHTHISNWTDYLSNPVYLTADALMLAGTAAVLSYCWDAVAKKIE